MMVASFPLQAAANGDAPQQDDPRFQAMIDLAPDAAPLPDGLAPFLAGATDDLPPSVADTWLAGTPDQVAAQIQRYLDLGISHFLLWFMDAPAHDGMQLFAESVAPRFRLGA
jgi:alkanesulfonate monooxygenase SsuD/methylene tetrahydromethanopterin reductase-like flavin-dependent oxidoreductase (luciferase family)